MIDTHTHLYLPEFDPEPSAAVDRAIEAGVSHMIFPNIDVASIAPMKALAALYPHNISLAMGLHPSEVGTDYREALRAIHQELTSGYPYVAVGEVGVDLYWDTTYRAQQLEAFRTQCLWALELGLPVIIHCREALTDTLDVLRSLPQVPPLVMHCFSGTADDVRAVRDVAPDAYFGIGGVVTFKNSNLRDVLPEIGLDHILLETDAPYLAPVPMRGRRNESSYLIHTASHIAQTLNIPLPTLDNITTHNAQTLFKLRR